MQNKLKGNKYKQAIIKKAEHSLIHNRIKCTNIKINHLQTELANTKISLQLKLDKPTFTNLQNTIFNNKEKPSYSSRTPISQGSSTSSPEPPQQPPWWPPRNQHFQHFCHLFYFPKYPGHVGYQPLQEGTNTWERSLLQKGLKLAVTWATIPVKEYISTTIVTALQAGEFNGVDWSGLYHDVKRILNTCTN